MAPRKKKKKAAYRWRAFTHWLNLLFLGLGGAAAVAYDPSIWFVLAPVEVGLMWLVPDLPPFRSRVDKELEAEELAKERTYYLEQLWGLLPPARKSLGQRIAGWFTSPEPEDVDGRVIDREARSFKRYLEMRQIVAKLRELEQVRGVSIPEKDIRRFEQVINGYLRFVMAGKSLETALQGMEPEQLQQDLAEIEAALPEAAPDLRNVLRERRRIKMAGLERLPKLRAMLELFRTRADAIVYQMRNIHGQVLADPGMDVNAFLEDLVDRQEIMVDPLGALEADNVLNELINPAAAQAAAQVSAEPNTKGAAAAGRIAGKS